MILALQFSQLSFEGAVEDGGEEGVEVGGGLGLQALIIHKPPPQT